MPDQAQSQGFLIGLGHTHYRHTERLGSAKISVVFRAVDPQRLCKTNFITQHLPPSEFSDRHTLLWSYLKNYCYRLAAALNRILPALSCTIVIKKNEVRALPLLSFQAAFNINAFNQPKESAQGPTQMFLPIYSTSRSWDSTAFEPYRITLGFKKLLRA